MGRKGQCAKRWLLVLSITIFCILLLSGEGSGKTIIVDDDGGADFTGIQNAIDTSEDGDTILVYNGTYEELLTINRSISLIGNGSEVTTLYGSRDMYNVVISADWVNVSGFHMARREGTGPDGGIWIESNHTRIAHMNFTTNGRGIRVEDARECVISDNSFWTRYLTAIQLEKVDTYVIANNSFIDNHYGIYAKRSEHGVINGNIFSVTYHGIYLKECNITGLTNNSITSEQKNGIQLRDSNNCTLVNNSMKRCSITIFGDLEEWRSHDIPTTNTVNEKPVYFITDTSGGEVPNGAGQVILVNCSDMMVANQNCSDGSDGISVSFSSNISIVNNTCFRNIHGITVQHSPYSVIANNNCSLNDYGGIIAGNSINSSFMENVCDFNDEYAIGISYCAGSQLLNNSCSKNEDAITVYRSNHSIIQNNICINNRVYGIIVQSTFDCSVIENTCRNNFLGLKLFNSVRTRIVGNTFENGTIGCIFDQSNDGSFRENYCSVNEQDGLELNYYSGNWTISNNSFISNYHGIRINRRENYSIEQNLCAGNTIGLWIERSHNSTISNNTYTDNEQGVHFQRIANISFTENRIVNNSIGITFGMSVRDILFKNNTISGNFELGVNATENIHHRVDVTLNQWGDPSGPYHEVSNSQGKGNGIVGDVLFDPWLDKSADPESDFLPVFVLLVIFSGLIATLVAVTFDIIKFDYYLKK